MSIKDKFLKMMKISDTDDIEEFDEEYEGYEEEQYEEYEEEAAEEEYEEYEEEIEEPAAKKPIFSFHRSKNKKEEVDEYEEEIDTRVIPFHGKGKEGEETVRVIKPQEFNEAQIVAEFLKDGKTIVVNLEGIEISQAQRIIDFIGGASFAVDGSLKAISNNIFIVAPGNIEVSGDLRDEIVGDSIISPELGKF